MMTAVEIVRGLQEGTTTAVDVVKASLAAIKERDGEIHAFLEVFEEEALERAKNIDEEVAKGNIGRLAGVPVAIKDNLLYKGHIASSASKMLEQYVAPYTSTAVQRLLDAGAIIIGRVNMDEFAAGSSNETSAFGVTKNPVDVTKVPGGSSGGSAAAVAAGFVPLALGSDTCGSVRLPASLCGTVGFKPTYGAVSRYGLMAMASSLDQIGPIATTVEDAALALEVLQGKDPMDATSYEAEEVALAELADAETVKGLRVGVAKEYFMDGMDADVKRIVQQRIDMLKEAGAEIVEISLPLTEYALPTYYIIQPAELSSNLGRYDGLRYGTRKPGSLKESYLASRKEGFGPEIKRRIMLGTFILSAGYYDAYYKKAQAVRTAIAEEVRDAFKQVDVILCPTSPTPAWNIGEKMDDPVAMYLSDVYMATANLAGLPAITVPSGEVNGLPVGIQFMAPRKQDTKLLHIAAAFEALVNQS